MQNKGDIGLKLSLGKVSLCYEDEHACQHVCDYQFELYPTSEVYPDTPDCIYLPMECLLSRFVILPLKQSALVDEHMMFHELANHCDIKEDDWWLSWDLKACDEGVAGMLFGLPETWRASMQEQHQAEEHCQFVWVDGYERLQSCLVGADACLVLDQDSEGLFLGVYDGQAWRGMRRMHGDINAISYQEITYTSMAMGFDKKSYAVRGKVGQALLDMILADALLWQGAVVQDLPSRHAANLDIELPVDQGLNLRHGAWRRNQGWKLFKPWKRSIVLLAVLTLLWLLATVVDIYRTDHALSLAEQRIEAAFHRGLPQAPVMLDPLAQLSQAAGVSHVQNTLFFNDLQAISEVYKKHPWQMRSLEWRDGRMYMAGEVSDIKVLNMMRSELASKLQREVRIEDTNMNAGHVLFRMQW